MRRMWFWSVAVQLQPPPALGVKIQFITETGCSVVRETFIRGIPQHQDWCVISDESPFSFDLSLL